MKKFNLPTVASPIIGQIKKKEIQAIPEILAFNFMMALVPMLIIFFQVLAFLSIETDVLNIALANYLPNELHNFIIDFLATASINFSDNPVLVIVTLVTLTLTISKGVNGIFKAFLTTYDKTDHTPTYRHRVSAILTFFLLLFFGAFATAFITTSHLILADWHFVIKTIVELGIFGLLCFTFFFLLFRLAPIKDKTARQILPGCLLTTAGFVITTMIFTFYVNRLANFHLVYGSLAIIIILLTWLYLVGWVINIGIQINYLLSRQGNTNKAKLANLRTERN